MEFYYAAAYLRLSKKDHKNTAESDSICSQRDLISSFVQKQENMKIYDNYIERKTPNLIQIIDIGQR